MINFRYHIVSLMAVFLALSVGIAVGVTLRPSVDEGLNQQAAQDRKQVQDLRAELDRRNRLDDYRDTWATRVGTVVTAGALTGDRVALIAMPDAPPTVIRSLVVAVAAAGGSVTQTARVDEGAFDPAQAEEVSQTLKALAPELGLADSASTATQLGTALGQVLLSPQVEDRSPAAEELRRALTRGGLASIDDDSRAQAQLAVVVTSEAPDPRPDPTVTAAHVELQLGLKSSARGVVVAGPNSTGIEGTDVLAIRANAAAADELSTVDVADLPGGVATVVLAGKEQQLGRTGHYGALTDADAPLPELPVR